MAVGFLDDLLGTHTTAAQDAATGAATANTSTWHNVTEAMQRGLNLDAQGDVTGYGGQAINAVNNASTGAAGALANYGQQAQGQITNGVNSAVGTVTGSNGQYAPYVQNGQSANGMLSNSLGLGGAAGTAAAQGAFTASPGYQYQQDQATDQAARKAASLGMAGSGNTLDAITRLSSNFADQEYGNWQDRLNGVSSTGLTAANAVSGNNAAAAGYQYGGGTTGGQLSQALGSSLANNLTNQGSQLSGINTGMGTSLSGLNTTLASNLQQNNQWGANATNTYNLNDAAAQDNATNYNSGIFSQLLGGLGNAFMSTATGQALKSTALKL